MRDVSGTTVDLRNRLVGENDRQSILPNLREGLGKDANGSKCLKLVEDHACQLALSRWQSCSVHCGSEEANSDDPA